jgi:hypothetical protein
VRVWRAVCAGQFFLNVFLNVFFSGSGGLSVGYTTEKKRQKKTPPDVLSRVGQFLLVAVCSVASSSDLRLALAAVEINNGAFRLVSFLDVGSVKVCRVCWAC